MSASRRSMSLNRERMSRAARAGEVVDMPPALLRYTVEVITRLT